VQADCNGDASRNGIDTGQTRLCWSGKRKRADSAPLFNKLTLKLQDGKTFTIVKMNSGKLITGLAYGGRKMDGYFIPHSDMVKGRELVITTK